MTGGTALIYATYEWCVSRDQPHNSFYWSKATCNRDHCHVQEHFGYGTNVLLLQNFFCNLRSRIAGPRDEISIGEIRGAYERPRDGKYGMTIAYR